MGTSAEIPSAKTWVGETGPLRISETGFLWGIDLDRPEPVCGTRTILADNRSDLGIDERCAARVSLHGNRHLAG